MFKKDKAQAKKFKEHKPKVSEKEKQKSAIRKLLTEGGDVGAPDLKVRYKQRFNERIGLKMAFF